MAAIRRDTSTMPTGPWGGMLRQSTRIEGPEQQGCVAVGRQAVLDLNQQPAPGLSASRCLADWP